MLAPSRVKYRKQQKGRLGGVALRGSTLSFGDFGLQAVEPGWVTERQIEAARIAINRHLKRNGKLWIRVFPQKPVGKKPAEVRMGKGKGAPDSWVVPMHTGVIMYEILGVAAEDAKEALRLASHKLPIRTKIVKRSDLL